MTLIQKYQTERQNFGKHALPLKTRDELLSL